MKGRALRSSHRHRVAGRAGPEAGADSGVAAGEREADGLDAPRRMALDGLAAAFEAAESGRDWFAMKAALRRVDDAVQAVWYASRVRNDGGV